MTVREFILVTHRWLGLAAGAILAILAATGVVLMWDLEGYWFARYVSSMHERLGFGVTGHYIVLLVTLIGVILEFGGVVLWWKRKTLIVSLGKGWWRACFDLHHLAGVVCLPLMLLGAVTALAMFLVPPSVDDELYRTFRRMHVGRFPTPLRALYLVATLGFVVQGVTGLVVWWKRKR
jgi:uncharacterized iron-regulated membrane protein